MTHKSPGLEAQYFRNYGIHSVENGASTDHLASFPTWEELEIALKNDLPSSGTIITPEYATFDASGNKSLDESVELIEERVQFVKDITQQTDAKVILGTPYKYHYDSDQFRPPYTEWHNTALEISHGNIITPHFKNGLLPIEKQLGLSAPNKRQRTVKNGRAVLICADLYNHTSEKDPLFQITAKDIIAPTMWATPLNGVEQAKEDKDEHYRRALERVVSHFVFENLRKVDRVTTVDKGRPDIAPYNAVFTRKDVD